MKELLLLRHAKSSWKDASLPDHDRLLNKRGERDAPRMGRFLREQDIVPDLIISSTAERARLTAQAVAEESGYGEAIRVSPVLYEGDLQDYIHMLRMLEGDPQRVMLVGHNPGLEEFLDLLTDAGESMPTASLALISLSIDNWREFSDESDASLVHLWRPRELDSE